MNIFYFAFISGSLVRIKVRPKTRNKSKLKWSSSISLQSFVLLPPSLSPLTFQLVRKGVFAWLTRLLSNLTIFTVGSIDESSCVGGVVTGSSTFKTSNGKDVLRKDVKCPNGFPNATRPAQASRIQSRQIVNECGANCKYFTHRNNIH